MNTNWSLRPLLYAALLIGGLAGGSHSYGRELTIAFGKDKPPFVYGEEARGLEIDIVREALKFKGYTIKVVHAPNLRLQVAIKAMKVDGSATVRTAQDGTYYSDNYIGFENYAITKKMDHLTINKVADLKGKTLVAWQNAYRDLGPAFEALFNPEVKAAYRQKYSELASQRDQNIQFWRGGAQVIIVDKTIFLWYRKILANSVDTTPEVVFHDIFPTRTYFQVAFKEQQVRDDFNAGLRQLRSNGIYQQLIDRQVK